MSARINPLFLLFGVLGGIIGFLVGEMILSNWEGHLPNSILMGLYWGQLAFFIGLMCLLAELLSPVLNGRGWRRRYAGDSWKMLLPAALIMLFIAGMGLQFIYGLSVGNHQPPQNIVLAIDVSGSMLQTDPNRESLKAAKALIQDMKTDKSAAVITFNLEAQILQPLTLLRDQTVKESVMSKLDGYGMMDGGTDIGGALAAVMEHLEAENSFQRKSMVIFISDGYSEVDLTKSLSPYQNAQITIHTLGTNAAEQVGNQLLQQIASHTGGTYRSVANMQDLSAEFGKIYKLNQSWHLVGDRTGTAIDSLYYMILRVISLLVIGVLIGLSLGMIFDNRFLASYFMIGGAVAGLLAGFILELGWQGTSMSPVWMRAAAIMVLAVVLACSTLLKQVMSLKA